MHSCENGFDKETWEIMAAHIHNGRIYNFSLFYVV